MSNFEFYWQSFAPALLKPGETLPDLCAEVRFEPLRRWRADYVIGGRVLIEIDGGVWTNGRHTRGQGYINDCEKLNRASELGFRILRFPTQAIEDNAIAVIEQALNTWRLTQPVPKTKINIAKYDVPPEIAKGAAPKQCPRCLESYPAAEGNFFKNRTTFDGFDTYCRKCQAVRQKAIRAKRRVIAKEGRS